MNIKNILNHDSEDISSTTTNNNTTTTTTTTQLALAINDSLRLRPSYDLIEAATDNFKNFSEDFAASFPTIYLGSQESGQLRLARRRHYLPYQSAATIQRRTGASRPQGRPYTDLLSARFYLYEAMEDFMSELLKTPGKAIVIAEIDAHFHNRRQFVIRSDQIRGRKRPSMRRLTIDDAEFRRANSRARHQASTVHEAICRQFEVSDITYVKIIRDSTSKVVKVESIAAGEVDDNYYDDANNNKLDFAYNDGETPEHELPSAQWIKRNVAFPRYKSYMRFHLLPGNYNFVFYQDPAMLSRDIYTGNTRRARDKGKVILINKETINIDLFTQHDSLFASGISYFNVV